MANKSSDIVGRVATIHSSTNEYFYFRELQDVLQSTSLPGSPYHPDVTSTTTDATVYPAPASQANGEQPQSKKRKMDDDSAASGAVTNDTQYARLPNLVHANKHLVDLHATLKRECEELVTLTDQVKLWISLTMPKCVLFSLARTFK